MSLLTAEDPFCITGLIIAVLSVAGLCAYGAYNPGNSTLIPKLYAMGIVGLLSPIAIKAYFVWKGTQMVIEKNSELQLALEAIKRVPQETWQAATQNRETMLSSSGLLDRRTRNTLVDAGITNSHGGPRPLRLGTELIEYLLLHGDNEWERVSDLFPEPLPRVETVNITADEYRALQEAAGQRPVAPDPLQKNEPTSRPLTRAIRT